MPEDPSLKWELIEDGAWDEEEEEEEDGEGEGEEIEGDNAIADEVGPF